MTTVTERIKFEDGREGRQTVIVHDDGSRELIEVVVTRNSGGATCRHVYAQRPSLMDRVYSLADLSNGLEGGARWSVVQ